jgi:hypothetical protein
MQHCFIGVLDSASMTTVYPFHAFMHKPCNTANILTLHQISQAQHGQASKVQPYVFGTLARKQHMFFVIYRYHKILTLQSFAPTARTFIARYSFMPTSLYPQVMTTKTKSGHAEDDLF